MNGGKVSGNSARSGGGVYVGSNGTFTKQMGGIIYGSNAVIWLKNTASSTSYGYAVYVSNSPAKKRNSTAGEGVMLDSTKSGSSGGWD
jgi:predicted outer membrane repeat protein